MSIPTEIIRNLNTNFDYSSMNDPNRNDDITEEGDSSPTSDTGNALLEEFRKQWKRELKTDEAAVVKSNDVDNESSQKIDEDKVNRNLSISVVVVNSGVTKLCFVLGKIYVHRGR